jgi:hypothetical protein
MDRARLSLNGDPGSRRFLCVNFGGSSAEAAARGRNTPHSALVFGPVGVHNALNGLVDLVEDEGAG